MYQVRHTFRVPNVWSENSSPSAFQSCLPESRRQSLRICFGHLWSSQWHMIVSIDTVIDFKQTVFPLLVTQEVLSHAGYWFHVVTYWSHFTECNTCIRWTTRIWLSIKEVDILLPRWLRKCLWGLLLLVIWPWNWNFFFSISPIWMWHFQVLPSVPYKRVYKRKKASWQNPSNRT